MEVYKLVEEYFEIIINFIVILIELVGVAILLVNVVMALIGLFKHKPHTSVKLGEGIALTLEILMCGELLRTIVEQEWQGLLVLGLVIVLRAAMSFLIQWEIHLEVKKGAKREDIPAEPGLFGLPHRRKHSKTEPTPDDEQDDPTPPQDE